MTLPTIRLYDLPSIAQSPGLTVVGHLYRPDCLSRLRSILSIPAHGAPTAPVSSTLLARFIPAECIVE